MSFNVNQIWLFYKTHALNQAKMRCTFPQCKDAAMKQSTCISLFSDIYYIISQLQKCRNLVGFQATCPISLAYISFDEYIKLSLYGGGGGGVGGPIPFPLWVL